MSNDKTGLLKSFLGSLNGDIAARLASAVETDRLLDGRVLPHDTILDGLRPALRGLQAGRTPTPLRLFCRPFEDLLTCAPRKTTTPLWSLRASASSRSSALVSLRRHRNANPRPSSLSMLWRNLMPAEADLKALTKRLNAALID